MSEFARRAVTLTFTVAVLAGCAAESPAPAPTAENTPLIDREVFFGNPERTALQISPDGSKIAYLAPVDGVLNVWAGPAGELDQARAVTRDTERGIRIFFWSYTNDDIIYLQDKAGDENWRVYATDVNTEQTRDLTPVEGVQARIYGVSHKFPEEILVGLNDRNPQLHDVHRINIKTGERSLVERNDQGFLSYTIDDDYRVRLAAKITAEGGSDILRKTDAGWKPFIQVPPGDMITTAPVTFDKTGKTLYLIDSRGRDTAALTAVDLASGETKVLGENSKADVSDIMIHPTEKTVEAVAFTYERKHWDVLDDSVRKDFEYLETVADGEAKVVDRTLDDQDWIVAYEMDNGPAGFYHYDRRAGKAEFLFSNRPALDGLPLAHMHPVVIDARDGLKLVSYYTLPVWTDADGDGKPNEPLPTVLFVHGGPWGRDDWGYHAYHQWLANRGYAVLSVNFRASTGFGKAFINAGDKEWGAKAHDDLLDAVDWAVAQGIAVEDKVAIMGGSYGGYATLAGLTMTPDKFAAGVDIVGPSNLITLLESIPPYWKPMLNLFTSRIGDHRTEEGRRLLNERSPLTYADKIVKPLLIAQGANDPRVKRAESDQIVDAMNKNGIPVTYVLYPDEGHGFARPENDLSFCAVTEAFLGRYLGGRVEPIGDDFQDSTIEVLNGADLVPGLGEAVSQEPEPEAAAG